MIATADNENHDMIGRITPLRGSQYFNMLLSLVFLWPAIVNGGAFYFPDTTAYIRGPDAIFHHATNWNSMWTQPAPTASRPSDAGDKPEVGVPDAAVMSPADAKPVLLGRSIFYGMLPFAGVAIGSDWLTILIQVMIAGAVVIGFLRHFIDPGQRAFDRTCIAAFALLAATPLPFFTAMLMPDFMAGIGIVAATALIMGWKRESRAGRIFWFALATTATLMHSANILILLAVAIFTLPVWAWRTGAAMRGIALVVTAALLGLAGEAAFTHAVTHVTGAAPIRPPFITARLIEDGPGFAYINRTCPRSGFLVCRYRNRMPAGSDAFLWSPDPAYGVFKAVTPAMQRALSAEQGRFVAAVTTTFPLDVAKAAVLAAGRQMSLLSLREFNRASGESFDRVPPLVMQSISTTRAYVGTMPVGIVEAMLWPMVFLSIATITVAVLSPATRRAAGYGVVVVAGWLANDVICGVLSTPHDRYHARIIWILPLVALLLVIRMRFDLFRRGSRMYSGPVHATAPSG